MFTWRLLLCQIVVLNKAKERMQPYQSNQEEEDPDIKKIKKVNCRFHIIMHKEGRTKRDTCVCCGCAGAKFHAWLAVPEEVEDHRPGLHLFPSC